MIDLYSLNKCVITSEIKNRHPYYNLQKCCGRSKYVGTIFIHPTDNLKWHSRKIFWINECWSSKWKIHKSTINKGILVQITWRIFYTNQKYLFISRISYNQPAPSAQPYTSLQGNKIVCLICIRPTEYFQLHPKKLAVSMDADSINTNKQVENKLCSDINYNPK